MRRQYRQAKGGGGGEIKKYFYVEDISGADNTLQIKKTNSSAPTVTFEYSYDGTNWSESISTTTTATAINIPANGKIYLRGVNSVWSDILYYNTIMATGQHNVGGNIMSLLYGDDFEIQNIVSTCSLKALFIKNSLLISAEMLELPATTLAPNCYQSMFSYCSGLTTAPELPATTLVSNCYQAMFYGCSGLTTAPELPATTLVSNCYYAMFFGCRGLKNIVAMFTQVAANSLTSWVSNVSTEGTFIMNKEAIWNPEDYRGVNGVPNGWIVKRKDPNTGEITE